MYRMNFGKPDPQAKPSSKPIAPNGVVMNSTDSTTPTAPGGFSGGQPQPRAHTGQASSSIALNHGNMVPTMQHATAGYHMQSIGHPNIRPNFQSHPSFRNVNQPVQYRQHVQQIFQHYPITHNQIVQHAGFLDQTAPNSPVGIPNNTAAGTQLQHQMSGNPHSTMAASVMTQQPQPSQPSQPVQPAQPAAPQMTMNETVVLVEKRMKEEEIDFDADIDGIDDVDRFSEAYNRVKQRLTPDLAKDFPEDTAQQKVLALGFYKSIRHWLNPLAGGSKKAFNRIKSMDKFSVKLVAWKLLVSKSRVLVRIDTS